MKASVTSNTGSNTFPFMRLPADIRLCVYDQLVAMPVTRLLAGPRLQIYHTKPSVGILRASRLVREEAYSIIERGCLEIHPSITVDVSANSSPVDLSQHLNRTEYLLNDLMYWFGVAQQEDKLHSCSSGEMHRSTLLSLNQWIECQFINDWEDAPTHCDNKAVTFEFMKRAILSLRKGTFVMHLILNDSNLFLAHHGDDWSSLIGTLIEISAACPSSVPGMLRISVTADCTARMLDVLSSPGLYERRLSPKMWRVDVVQDATQLLESS